MATRTARRRRGAEGVTGDTAASPPTRCATEEDLADTCRSPLLAKLGTIKEAILLHGKHAEARVYVGILSGYRLHDLTFRQSLRSLFQWHNETLNVWTHLTGFVLFVCLLVYTAKLAGAARLPEPLVECAHAVERAACLRTLALSACPSDELYSESSSCCSRSTDASTMSSESSCAPSSSRALSRTATALSASANASSCTSVSAGASVSCRDERRSPTAPFSGTGDVTLGPVLYRLLSWMRSPRDISLSMAGMPGRLDPLSTAGMRPSLAAIARRAEGA